MGGKLAIIIFGLTPTAFLLWALGINTEKVVGLFIIASLAVLFLMPVDEVKK